MTACFKATDCRCFRNVGRARMRRPSGSLSSLKCISRWLPSRLSSSETISHPYDAYRSCSVFFRLASRRIAFSMSSSVVPHKRTLIRNYAFSYRTVGLSRWSCGTDNRLREPVAGIKDTQSNFPRRTQRSLVLVQGMVSHGRPESAPTTDRFDANSVEKLDGRRSQRTECAATRNGDELED